MQCMVCLLPLAGVCGEGAWTGITLAPPRRPMCGRCVDVWRDVLRGSLCAETQSAEMSRQRRQREAAIAADVAKVADARALATTRDDDLFVVDTGGLTKGEPESVAPTLVCFRDPFDGVSLAYATLFMAHPVFYVLISLMCLDSL